ncbi:MAG TPA: helix-turn-helix transcriptional regulator [Candidatus Limnocylindrales bacterium]|nr:helix-turn-helix transcriptional regulator [Candidatus Limnocylindrales bacterium]
MDDVRLGLAIRAVRRRQRLRQRDIARRARVSASTVHRIERGQLGSVPAVRRVCTALGISLEFAPRWRGTEMARLLDEEHAAAVEWLTQRLMAGGWEVIPEYTFSRYGERGAVDVLAWSERTRAVLMVEVKTRLVDIQALLSGLDRKRRLVPGILARERGVEVRGVAAVLAVTESGTARRSVGRHAATFAAVLPARTMEVRRWLAEPRGHLAGVWFLPRTLAVNVRHGHGGPDRVRVPRPTPS